jgi:hypothetical protein
MTTYETALANIDAGIRQMEEAGGHPLKTRAVLEKLSAEYFWRGVSALTLGSADIGGAVSHDTPPIHHGAKLGSQSSAGLE